MYECNKRYEIKWEGGNQSPRSLLVLVKVSPIVQCLSAERQGSCQKIWKYPDYTKIVRVNRGGGWAGNSIFSEFRLWRLKWSETSLREILSYREWGGLIIYNFRAGIFQMLTWSRTSLTYTPPSRACFSKSPHCPEFIIQSNAFYGSFSALICPQVLGSHVPFIVVLLPVASFS